MKAGCAVSALQIRERLWSCRSKDHFCQKILRTAPSEDTIVPTLSWGIKGECIWNLCPKALPQILKRTAKPSEKRNRDLEVFISMRSRLSLSTTTLYHTAEQCQRETTAVLVSLPLITLQAVPALPHLWLLFNLML